MEIGAAEAAIIVPVVFVVLGAVIAMTRWMTKVDEDRARFNTFIDKMEVKWELVHGKLESIARDLVRIEATRTTTARASPLKLTDLGCQVSDELRAKEWARETAARLLSEVGGMEAYRIVEYSRDYVDNTKLADEIDARIAGCMAKHEIDEHQVLDVLFVELRDALLHRPG